MAQRRHAALTQRPCAICVGSWTPSILASSSLGNRSDLPDAAPFLQAQPGALSLPSPEDVDMGGMEDAEEIADSITLASVSGEVSQPHHGQGGSQAALRRRQCGSRVPTGIFAL